MVGKRKNYLRFGVAINDANYNTSKCPYMRRWSTMLQRCYSKAYQKSKPTYIGCEVCEEWLTFSNFKRWMETQDWEGKELDKDLIGNGRLYSSDSCIFVRSQVNSYLSIHNYVSEFPLGVSRSGNGDSFVAQCSDGKGSKVYLGYGSDVGNLHRKWQVFKIECGLSLLYEEEDYRVKEYLKSVIEHIFYDICNGVETTLSSIRNRS